MSEANGRAELLERYGRFYGDEHFALAFTAGTAGDDAKRITTKGWDQTRPVSDGDFGAGLLKERGQSKNVAVVLRPSNLIVIECDSEPDLVAIEDLFLPSTLTVRSSEPYKRHFYFRPPAELEALPYVAFRFESGRVTADSGRYFLAPPSLHPSGVQYSFLPGLGPGDTDIVELPEQLYRELVERARREDSEQRERIAVDPEAKISAGQRRETIFRYACMLRRWGRPYDAILAECLQFNAERCDPPVSRDLVEVQVKGAMKKQGDQELDVGDAPAPIIFETLRSFLERDVPKSESLVGVARDGTNLLPRFGWVMPWGKEGSGKTSILVDLLFHACAGMDWLQYPIERELKIVAIVNEGIPGGLQDKLRQKTERWGERLDSVLDNLFVYASPWGEFTLANQRMVQHAQDFARDVGADYVALDPLHTIGTSGVGSPVETEQFKHMLREFGLWDWIGIITAHHANKAGMLSGDWGRHPDTVILLEKDGKNPSTKFTLHKARPADPTELGVPCLLDWEVETLGYTRRELSAPVKVGDDELLERIKKTLDEANDPLSMKALQAATEGNATRISDVAKAALERGEIGNLSSSSGRFQFVPRNRVPEHEESEESEQESEAQMRMVDTKNRFLAPEESLECHPSTAETIPRFLTPRRGVGMESESLGFEEGDIPL